MKYHVQRWLKLQIARVRLWQDPLLCRAYCGSLVWTVEKYGRITHKHGCPLKRNHTFCQTYPWGCDVPF